MLEIDFDLLQPSDLPALLALWQELGCDMTLKLDQQELYERTFGDPTCQPELLLLARTGSRLAGFCLGCIRGNRGVIKAFGVHPDHQRQGIATHLFQEIEARFAARGLAAAYAGAVPPNYFDPGISLARMPAIAFLMQHGYETDRHARVDMCVELNAVNLDYAEACQRLESAGIKVRRASEDEIEAVAAFAAEHFSDVWRSEVTASRRSTPPSLFVASKGSCVVAFAAHDVVGPARFGPTGTHPDYRSRGIGTVLLKMCLENIRAAGYRIAQIAWAEPVDYYARTVGATISSVYWCFEKTLDSGAPGDDG